MSDTLYLGTSPDGTDLHLLLPFANRHGLITGATGTGKTVSLQSLVEGFSRAGVPVFLADVKGDLSGLAAPGGEHPKARKRAKELGLAGWAGRATPTVFWDLAGERGHPVRATVSEMGPLLLARMLELNEVQAGVLQVLFRVADDRDLLLIDLKDLQAMLAWCAAHASELATTHGNVTKASVGAIQRALLTLDEQGGSRFFGEPALDLSDLLLRSGSGEGCVHVLAADRLMRAPRLYATFLLWMLSELFESLPEVGDVAAPKLVFVFDEAHLLFEGAPPALLTCIEQVVRLIRSKGVAIWFVTQSPLDVPESVLGQIGNRVQHALRAFTPKDQRAVRAAAETFRPNPAFGTAQVITELPVGEALVSFLDPEGVPRPVERCRVAPPQSRIGPLDDAERERIVGKSPYRGRYDVVEDRPSAWEALQASVEEERPPSKSGRERYEAAPGDDPWGAEDNRPPLRRTPSAPTTRRPLRRTDSVVDVMAKTAARTATQVAVKEVSRALFGGRSGGVAGKLMRGILGGLLK